MTVCFRQQKFGEILTVVRLHSSFRTNCLQKIIVVVPARYSVIQTQQRFCCLTLKNFWNACRFLLLFIHAHMHTRTHTQKKEEEENSWPPILSHQRYVAGVEEWSRWNPSAKPGTEPQCLAWNATEHTTWKPTAHHSHVSYPTEEGKTKATK